MSKMNEGDVLVWTGDKCTNMDQNMMYDYQEMLKEFPVEEIEKFLRRKKLENIEDKKEIK